MTQGPWSVAMRLAVPVSDTPVSARCPVRRVPPLREVRRATQLRPERSLQPQPQFYAKASFFPLLCAVPRPDSQLLSRRRRKRIVGHPSPPPDVDSQPLNLLIQGRKRNHEPLGGLRLIPIRPLQHIYDNTPFNFVHDLEKGWV